MFVDKVRIHVKGGNGGNGAVSFFRAKYVTNGGPDGGDGGKGGDIIFIADEGMNTLLDFRYKRMFKAQPGQDGGKRNCFGADGEDIIIKVPVGTIIREANSNKIMADMTENGQKKVLIKGGKGGKGNQHFATPTRQAPRYAERGRTSKEYDLILELKLIADVGLIGFPNVGKSTLLSMVTNANPKIANYHFTTLSPNLGVVRSRWGEDFVMADIPGLIEGASEGIGLGHEFLRHVERTKVFIHVVDGSGLEGDPIENYEKIQNELVKYKEDLANRPSVIAVNKMDIPEAQENFEKIKAKYEPMGIKVFPISAIIHEGVDQVLYAVADALETAPKFDMEEVEENTVVYNYEEEEAPFVVHNLGNGQWTITGKKIERLVSMTSLVSDDAIKRLSIKMRNMGIDEALRNAGCQDGDVVSILDFEFEFYD